MGASEQPPGGSIEADLVVKIAEAKSRLSELVQRAEAGERVLISRGPTPVFELRPVSSAHSPIGLYQEIAGPLDMAALHEALDEGWSDRELDEFEGDLDEELRAR